MAHLEHISEHFGYLNLETLDGVATIKIDGVVGGQTRGALVAALEQAFPAGVNPA